MNSPHLPLAGREAPPCQLAAGKLVGDAPFASRTCRLHRCTRRELRSGRAFPCPHMPHGQERAARSTS